MGRTAKFIFQLNCLIAVLSLCGLSTRLSAVPFNLPNQFEEIPLRHVASFYIDRNNELKLDSFSQPGGLDRFQTTTKTSFGLLDVPVWALIQLKNNSSDSRALILEIPHPSLDFVEIYRLVPSGRFELVWSTGDSKVFSSRPILTRNFAFPLNLNSQSESTYLLRMTSQGPLYSVMNLLTAEAFQSKSELEQFCFGGFCGCLLALMLYNFGLACSTRERVYLFYSIYIGISLMFFASWSGVTFRYFWPNSPKWGNMALPIFLSQLVFWATIFVREYFNQFQAKYHDQSQWVERFARAGLVCGLLHPFLAVFLDYHSHLILALVYVGIMCPFAIAAASMALFDVDRRAIYFLVAWTTLLVSAVVHVLGSLGILSLSGIARYSVQTGAVVEAILLSFALGDRFNQVKKDKINVLLKLRGNLENLFDMTQKLAIMKDINGLGAILRQTIVKQIPELDSALIEVYIPDPDRSLRRYVCELSQLSSGEIISVEDQLNLQINSPKRLTLPFTTELRGKCLLSIHAQNLPLTGIHIEDQNFISTLSSVLAISLDNIIYTSDLQVLVAERTKELNHALVTVTDEKGKIHFLLDTMNIGVLTFSEDLRIEDEFSKYLAEILAISSSEIAGQELIQMIFAKTDLSPDQLNRLQHSLEFVFNSDSISWDLNEHNFIQQVEIKAPNGVKILSFDWNPLIDESDRIKKIMLCVRDITRQVQIESLLKDKNNQFERVIRVFSELIKQQRTSLQQGFLDMQMRMGRIEALSHKTENNRDRLIELHTIKGTARMLGLSGIIDAAHEAETKLSTDLAGASASFKSLSQEQDLLAENIIYYKNLFRDLLGGSLDGESSAPALKGEDSLFDIVMQAVGPARANLEKSGISLVEMNCRDSYMEWPRELLEPLRIVLGHAFNNAADHGYIFPSKISNRADLRRARFEVGAEVKGGLLHLWVRDYGNGIDFEKLQGLAIKSGRADQSADRATLLSLLLEGGMSSAEQVSKSSGRGVGVSAIASLARELGGTASIRAAEMGGTVVELHLPIVSVNRAIA